MQIFLTYLIEYDLSSSILDGLSEEAAGAVDTALILEHERLQKVDNCVADNAGLLQKVDIRVANPVIVLLPESFF